MPTKRKPRWSDIPRWCAALFLGAALCLAGPAAAATSASGKPGATKKKPAGKAKKPAVRKAAGKKKASTVPLTHPEEDGFFGAASFYGRGFQGRQVANGERFDAYGMTAASNRVPLGTWVAVRRMDSERCVVVKVNDRMHSKHRVRVIDLSRGAAEKIRMIAEGVVMVRVLPLRGAPDGDREALCHDAFAEDAGAHCADCLSPVAPARLSEQQGVSPDADASPQPQDAVRPDPGE